MVEVDEGSSKAYAQFVGPNMKLSNWEATTLPTRKEFCSFYAGCNDMTCMRNFQPTFEEISKEIKKFEEKPKPNLNETETINLGDRENVRETKISVHLEPQVKEEIIKTLFEYKDVFAWSYNDMSGLSTNLVVHKLSTDPKFPPVKQKLRKFKTDMVPKKDGKTRVCVDYRDLNKASPKDDFPLLNIHILIDNCAKHEIGFVADCYAGYLQILIDEEDAEKTVFITPWGTYCYRVMPFGLNNAGATYMRTMTTIFHDMIHKEIGVYIDDVIIKSKKQSNHVKYLRKFFQRLRMYNLKINPAKCAFGVPSRKLLGFVVSRRGIELDSSKIKAIQELPPPKNKTKVMRLLGMLNYIRRFAKWQILLTEFDIIYVTRTAMKTQALADHLAENLVDEEYEPLKTYFPDEEVMYVDEVDHDENLGWKLFFDGAANMKSAEIRDVLISEIGQHYPITAQLRFYCIDNMAEYKACILVLRLMSNKAYVDPVHIQVGDQHAYCNMVEEEIDGEPWFHDIKEYIKSGVYPVHATGDQKRTIRCLASGFFLSGGIFYKRTPDLGLLRCIDAKEASTIMAELHSGVCGPHMHGYVLAKKIL
ncbi:uncharacterized protein [Nicotiana sylvestris]|uniref:uncharacterized protein n=1 Tax=Nicotiana sylvestris TaxID=4096 RepID=UPI00388CE304